MPNPFRLIQIGLGNRGRMWAEIEALDGKIGEDVQIDALFKLWNLQRNLTRWLLNQRGSALDIAELVQRYAPGVGALRAALPGVLTPTSRADYDVDVEKWQGMGFPDALAVRREKPFTINSLCLQCFSVPAQIYRSVY